MCMTGWQPPGQAPLSTPLKTGSELQASLPGTAAELATAGQRQQVQLGVGCCMTTLPGLIAHRCPDLGGKGGEGNDRLGSRKSGAE